jgi:inhibitor of cysteine peptidase
MHKTTLNILNIFIILALLLIIKGCALSKPITLTEKDNGKTITLKQGETFLIKLPSNPTTGYDWYIKTKPENIEQSGATDYIQGNKKIMGAPGLTVFKFKAGQKGTGTLVLIYMRKWEGILPSSKKFSINIIVN